MGEHDVPVPTKPQAFPEASEEGVPTGRPWHEPAYRVSEKIATGPQPYQWHDCAPRCSGLCNAERVVKADLAPPLGV